MKTMTLSALAKHFHSTTSSLNQVSGVCVDTRLLKPGDLFFALPGQKADGQGFLLEAALKGASGAVVRNTYGGPDYGLPLIRVDDALVALQELAKIVLRQRKSKIIGVTGSVGKTTTKDFIAHLLGQKYRVGASPGNSNSKIGLPLAILNHTQGDEDVLVLEMGLTCAGDIAGLVRIAPPDVAVITLVALVHAMNFDSLEDIGRAKAEIFSSPATRLGVLHRGIANFEELCSAGPCPKISFECDFLRADYRLGQSQGRLLVSAPRGESAAFSPLPVPGKHNLHNFLCACTVARCFGLDWKEIQEGAATLSLPERRLQKVEKDGVLFINDSYNASLSSVKAALDSLPEPKPGGKRIAVLGEMLELGKFSEECHREAGEYALSHVDRMLCLGSGCRPIADCWKNAGRDIFFAEERGEILRRLRAVIKKGDVVLLKGSRAKELWKVLEEL